MTWLLELHKTQPIARAVGHATVYTLTTLLPILSSPVNTLVLVPGKYRFGDFVRIGIPFTIIVLILTVLLVPWLLPLHP